MMIYKGVFNVLFFLSTLFLINEICSGPVPGYAAQEGAGMKLESTAFQNNAAIPSKFTCEEVDINPPLSISGVPAEAKSLALIMDDPDAPVGTWVHWVVYDIPPTTTIIKQNSKPGKEGKNDFGRKNYGGPCPPLGQHRYFLKLYALDVVLHLQGDVNKASLEEAMSGHIISQAELLGVYRKVFE